MPHISRIRRLGWEMIPIINKNVHDKMKCCGVMFSTKLNKQLMKWLLSTLFNLQESSRIETIFTDQDSAALYSFPEFNQNRRKQIKNCLCKWHKIENFRRQLLKYVKDKSIRSDMMKYFKKYLSTPYDKRADIYLGKIIKMKFADINRYLKNYVVPYQSKLVRSKITCLTLGISTTSTSECCNSVVKQTQSRSFETLKSMRKKLTFLIEKKERNEEFRASRARSLTALEVQKHYPIKGPRETLEKLNYSYLKSKRLIIIDQTNQDKIFYQDPQSKDEHMTEFDTINKICSCFRLQRDGIVCSHLIRFREDNGEINPFHGIHPFYELSFDNELAQAASITDEEQFMECVAIESASNKLPNNQETTELFNLSHTYIKYIEENEELKRNYKMYLEEQIQKQTKKLAAEQKKEKEDHRVGKSSAGFRRKKSILEETKKSKSKKMKKNS